MAKKDIGAFHPRRSNQWFSDAQYAADVDVMTGTYRIQLTSLMASGASTAVISAVAVSAAGSSTLASAYSVDAEFGRTLTVVGTVGATTGATSLVTLYGLDYLSQPMGEQVTLNGTTAIETKKAFKWLTAFSWGAQGASNMNIGTGNSLGLPYRTLAMVTDFVNQIPASTAGGFSAASSMTSTAVMTLTSADPRGTYKQTGQLPNGSRSFELIAIADVVNNIYGPQHVTA